MKRATLISFLIILFIGISYYINHQIQANNMVYHYGKDNGVLAQFKSIIIMSLLFYMVVTQGKRLKSAIIGLGAGVASGVAGYLLYSLTYDLISNGIVYPIYSIIIFIGLFLLIERFQALNRQKKIELR